MRIIFAGTPDFAATHLQALITNNKHTVVAVYTQPDRRAGRGKKLFASPVKQLALNNSIPIEQPHTLKEPEQQKLLANYNADIMVVAAYGMLLPKAVLSIPAFGCINVHASLLPRWRGAAPIERAIEAGDNSTGITIMQMDIGLDTGDMLLTAKCPIDEAETGDSLRSKLIELGAPLLLQALERISEGLINAEKQDDTHSNYAKKLNKSEAQINWQESASNIERKIRAFTSAMPCYSMLDQQRVRILQTKAIVLDNKTVHQAGEIIAINGDSITVQCAKNALIISQLQMPSAKPMSIKALLNGKPNALLLGQCFSLPESNMAGG